MKRLWIPLLLVMSLLNGCSDSPVTPKLGEPGSMKAVITGAMTMNLEGFAVLDTNQSPSTIILGKADREKKQMLYFGVTRLTDTPPAVGTFAIADLTTNQFTKEYTAAFHLMEGDAPPLTQYTYVGRSGSLTITEVQGTTVRGTMQFEAVEMVETGPDTPPTPGNRTLQVKAEFTTTSCSKVLNTVC